MWSHLNAEEKEQVVTLLSKWVMKLAGEQLNASGKTEADWDRYRGYTGTNGPLWLAADIIRLENRAKAEAEAAKKQARKK